MKSKITGTHFNGSIKLQLWRFAILLSFIVSSCDEAEPPIDPLSVTTDTPTAITDAQAKLGGVVTKDGGNPVTARGVCVSLSANPTIDDPNDEALNMGSGIGAFTDTFEGFPASTTVHVRAFATNSSGTVYGEDKVFTTLAPAAALAVTTATPEGVTSTEAILGGNVTNNGGSAVTARGVCISLTANPTIDDPVNDDVLPMGSGTGAFSNTIVGLPSGTIIHVRAYATNSNGTAYGEDKVFTTLALSGCPLVNVTASISTPTTWVTGKVYMLTNTITVSSTLTIEPGTVVKLNGGSIDIISGGKIVANGTETNRIVFTSFADDNYCGDSNMDGTASAPQKGDWQMLFLNNGGSLFKYCDFLYGGKNRNGRNNVVEVSVSGPLFTFDHCTFAHTLSASTSTAYAFYAQTYMNDHTTSVFTNNAFYDNDRPIFLDVNYTMNPNNIFHDPNNPSVTNARNGIFLSGGTIAAGSTVSWNVSEVSYVVSPSCRAFSGSTLNIGPNVVVKFIATDSELISTNSINLNATAFLTSYKDDAHGGDTNGDGSASSPAVGDWYGYGDTSTGFTVWVHSANILYASH